MEQHVPESSVDLPRLATVITPAGTHHEHYDGPHAYRPCPNGAQCPDFKIVQAFTARAREREKRAAAARGHDCSDFLTYVPDSIAGGRLVKHHWICGRCGDLLQVG